MCAISILGQNLLNDVHRNRRNRSDREALLSMLRRRRKLVEIIGIMMYTALRRPPVREKPLLTRAVWLVTLKASC